MLAAPLGLVLGLGLLRSAAEAGWPLPLCGFRQATGLPCPGCGSTRALLALTDGDVAGAWRFNPLAAALMLGFGLAGGVWIMDRAFGTQVMARMKRGVRRYLGLGDGPEERWPLDDEDDDEDERGRSRGRRPGLSGMTRDAGLRRHRRAMGGGRRSASPTDRWLVSRVSGLRLLIALAFANWLYLLSQGAP